MDVSYLMALCLALPLSKVLHSVRSQSIAKEWDSTRLTCPLATWGEIIVKHRMELRELIRRCDV